MPRQLEHITSRKLFPHFWQVQKPYLNQGGRLGLFLDLNKHALIVYSDIVRFFHPCFLLSSWAILNTLHFVSHRAQVARLFPRGPAVRRRRHAALSRPEICIRQLIISIRRLDLFFVPIAPRTNQQSMYWCQLGYQVTNLQLSSLICTVRVF